MWIFVILFRKCSSCRVCYGAFTDLKLGILNGCLLFTMENRSIILAYFLSGRTGIFVFQFIHVLLCLWIFLLMVEWSPNWTVSTFELKAIHYIFEYLFISLYNVSCPKLKPVCIFHCQWYVFIITVNGTISDIRRSMNLFSPL